MITTRALKRILVAPVAGLLLLGASQQAAATFARALDLPRGGEPDVFNADLAISYTASSGVLTMSGTNKGGTWTFGSNSAFMLGMDFLLTLNLISNGSVLNSGSLSIINKGGSTPDLGLSADEVLLAGSVYDFGVKFSDSDSGTFEVLLNSTAASAALGFGVGGRYGVIFNADGLNDGWDAGGIDFSGIGNSDTFDTPAPASLLLLATGLVGLGLRRRAR